MGNKKGEVEKTFSLGEKLADKVTNGIGCWSFIIIQTLFLILWMILNETNIIALDPFPHLFLNIMLSFQAAYATPFILMSQNRQSEIDRLNLLKDIGINRKELKLIHQLVLEVRALKQIIGELKLN